MRKDKKTLFDWYVELHHAKQGFGKRFQVKAYDYKGAIEQAKTLLDDRYDFDEFDVVEIRRGRFA